MGQPAESVPLRQAVCEWIADLRGEMALAPRTVDKYERIATRYAAALSTRGHRDWRSVSERDARAVLSGLAVTASPATLRLHRAVYSQLHGYLQRSGSADCNPVSGIRPAKLAKRLPRGITRNQVTTLLDSITGTDPLSLRDRALFELAYSTGARSAELLGLDVEDVDLEARTIRVMGKGQRERLCLFGDAAHAALSAWLAPRTGPLHGAVFPLSAMGMWKALQRRCRLAGIPPISAHQLRHSFATHLVESGADLRSVQILMGHASIRSTEVYVQPSTQHLRKAHARLAR